MKIEVDPATIDKLVGKRVAEFNKTILTLENKIKRRDNKIHKLERELEVLKAGRMDTEQEICDRISKYCQVLVQELMNAKWVQKYDNYCSFCQDDYHDD